MLKQGQGVGVWVTAREAFWIALEALRSHKLRTFLTLLGVVIATSTLIVVMSVVNGMNLYIAEDIASLGTNTFVLHQFQWAQGFDAFLNARRRNLDDHPPLAESAREGDAGRTTGQGAKFGYAEGREPQLQVVEQRVGQRSHPTSRRNG